MTSQKLTYLLLATAVASHCGCTAQVTSDTVTSTSSADGERQDRARGDSKDSGQDASTQGSWWQSSQALLSSGRWIDLTHTFDESTIYWPTEVGFRLLRRAYGFTEAGYFYAANRLDAAEHGGTHVDAPIHFFQNRQTADQIPIERLVGEAAVIDVTRQCADADYQISVEDLRGWEARHKRPLVDVIVLLRTGYARFWPDRAKYLGTEQTGESAVAKLHFPGLAPDAARWLVEHRAIKAIGIDTASIDYGQSSGFQSHITLFEKNVPAFENVANMQPLPESGALVFALPMKIGGGSGGPLRIVALLPPAR